MKLSFKQMDRLPYKGRDWQSLVSSPFDCARIASRFLILRSDNSQLNDRLIVHCLVYHLTLQIWCTAFVSWCMYKEVIWAWTCFLKMSSSKKKKKYRSRGPGFDFPVLPDILRVVGLEQGPLSLVSTLEKLLGRNSSDFSLESRE
jgi:hypothetical protein